ncbi:MAG: hydrogenase formation protein HypD [Chlorobiales bacterium]|nr:hydrogenase formation protein HypD [Chlorobiales bacterium]
MKYIDEYRDPDRARRILKKIKDSVTRPWSIMEICGGQTHSIIRNGIDQLLPDAIRLVHGPGCPVCVTPLETLDRALSIAERPEVVLASFGDMLRVPGSGKDLLTARSEGADVRVVYSPLEALAIARDNPHKEVVFLAIGFETTAPGNAMAVKQAAKEGLNNFSELVSQFMVPPAMKTILSSEQKTVEGFLAAGHVCTITGYEEYESIAEKYHVPIVPTGFEPVDILSGILRVIEMLESGRLGVFNEYSRVVSREGNEVARKTVNEVFEVADRQWRGIGVIPQSGIRLRGEFSSFDAEKKYDVAHIQPDESPLCRSGEVLQGIINPGECGAFGKECTPLDPLGAPMVSAEGTCAAYYKYHKRA